MDNQPMDGPCDSELPTRHFIVCGLKGFANPPVVLWFG